MNVEKQRDCLVLSFNLMESRMLLRVLRAIRKAYQLTPGQIDPQAAAVLYSTKGCQSAGLSAEETRDWLDNLHQFKSAHLKLVERWIDQISRRHEDKYSVSLPGEDAAAWMSVLNDHRLLAAARNDVGQTEMDTLHLGDLRKLTPGQQLALLEIHFLASLIEQLLLHMPGNPGRWHTDL